MVDVLVENLLADGDAAHPDASWHSHADFDFATLQLHQVPSTARHPPQATAKMSLVSGEKSNFQFILRLLNTNVRIPRNPILIRARHEEEENRWTKLATAGWDGNEAPRDM